MVTMVVLGGGGARSSTTTTPLSSCRGVATRAWGRWIGLLLAGLAVGTQLWTDTRFLGNYDLSSVLATTTDEERNVVGVLLASPTQRHFKNATTDKNIKSQGRVVVRAASTNNHSPPLLPNIPLLLDPQQRQKKAAKKPALFNNGFSRRTRPRRNRTVAVPSLTALDTKKIFVVLCELSGELGNALGFYARCHALLRMLQHDHGVPTSQATIVLRRKRGATRWVNAKRDLQLCFPHFRSLDFEAGNSALWERRVHQLVNNVNPFRGVLARNPSRVDRTLRSFVDAMNNHKADGADDDDWPFLYSTQMAGLDFFVDRYLDDLRQTALAFDSQACCNQIPYPDETVFHLRNYATELSIPVAAKLGLLEPNPEQTSHELLGHVPKGGRVAVLSRFAEAARPHLEALRNRGLQARLLSNQTGPEDFCFLKHAQEEVVGLARSTYLRWAVFLAEGNTRQGDNNAPLLFPRAVLYSVDTPELRARVNGDMASVYLRYNFTYNAALRSRLSFRILQTGRPIPNEEGVLPLNGTAAVD